MTVKEIVDIIIAEGGNWVLVIIIMASLIQISPIKLDPWTALMGWIGKKLNSSVISKVDEVDKKIDKVDKKLDEHISESEDEKVRQLRSSILSFGSSIISGRNYHKEKFDFMVLECDRYETYCKEHEIKNGVAEATIKEIRRIYSNRLAEDSFLKEGQYES